MAETRCSQAHLLHEHHCLHPAGDSSSAAGRASPYALSCRYLPTSTCLRLVRRTPGTGLLTNQQRNKESLNIDLPPEWADVHSKRLPQHPDPFAPPSSLVVASRAGGERPSSELQILTTRLKAGSFSNTHGGDRVWRASISLIAYTEHSANPRAMEH